MKIKPFLVSILLLSLILVLTISIVQASLIENIWYNTLGFLGVIEITHANHLNFDKIVISDVYNEVKNLDGIWSETILEGEYVRVTFEKNLTSNNDITLYPRIVSGNPKIEVYEKDSEIKITEFYLINNNSYQQVILTNLQNSQDIFDLKIIEGSVEFEHIIDPTVVKTYTYNGITQNGLQSAYNSDLDGWPPADGIGTVTGNTNGYAQISDSAYVNVSTSDNLRQRVPGAGSGDFQMFWMVMQINQTPSIISKMTFEFEGYPATTSGVRMYLFNVTSNAWMPVAKALAQNNFPTSDTTLTGILNSDFANYVNASGSLRWGMYNNGSNLNFFVDFVQVNVTITDNTYPVFSSYWDNNASLSGSGIGLFNVTLANTNGSVLLEINNTNYSATNFAGSVYNVSVDFTNNGTYNYTWHAWGSGGLILYNSTINISRSYTVNVSTSTCTYSGSGNWNLNCADNCVFATTQTIANNNNVTITGTGTLTFNNGGKFSFTGTDQCITISSGCTLNINTGGGWDY